MSTPAGALSVLSRIRANRPEPSPYERCEMCAAPVADEHQHVVNVGTRSLLCACRPCYLLFTHDDADLTYRAVPDRYLSFPDLEAVERRAAGRPVARVGVRIGAVHRVEAAAFEQSFQLAAGGGPAAGATTQVVVVPVHGHCMDCRNDFHAADPSPACPSCGSLDVAVDGGDEVILEWLQYVDVADPTDATTESVPAHTHVGCR